MGVDACVDTHTLDFLCVCRTFAYVTVKDRMPRILTQVIDTVHKEEANMKAQYGEVKRRVIAYTVTLATCAWCSLIGMAYLPLFGFLHDHPQHTEATFCVCVVSSLVCTTLNT